ncbi:hypothetical protein NEUTE1DRAFT_148419 [Neurospora tetrasperma FGSC 2508]|uniref:Uncharacterized protein n=1 Tax=Neurospora tetrasperma (strain FGSC 2508 / ATCC MYA-4615 / P0657) TaxID=510951 RepID=F8MVH9_NEUT8|nr:uncharacterized protein NEUTE1DRAFT_148419 [Neurospora tetrasperma FGSC 2508]EGO53931.1 hypothetical protein NEUTE1DRAFT_148419 [Neurospora tetrasperma FGSC 2508]
MAYPLCLGPSTPYNFGLGSDFQIALIQPFLYFFLAVLLDIAPREVTPKPQSLTGTASLDTGSLTQPDELLASLAQSRNETRVKAACISLLFTVLLCFFSHQLDFMWHDPHAFHSRHGPVPSFTKNGLFDSDPIPAPDDYAVTKSREATRLLFVVVISGVLCPIADCLCRHGDGGLVCPDDWESRLLRSDFGRFIADEVYDSFVLSQSGYDGMMHVMKAIMFLVRIVFPCMATAATTIALAFATFGRRHGVVDIWDRRIERWVVAFALERSYARLDEWRILWQRGDQGRSMQAVLNEVDMGERNKETIVWRRGMKEGRGYGPDYWLPREKEPQRPFQFSSAVDEDAYRYVG